MKSLFLSFLLLIVIQVGYAQDDLKVFGHITISPELNRNIRLSDQSTQADYDQFRLKMNFGFKYLYEDFTFSGRLTTGDANNPRSAYVNLGNTFSNKVLQMDKAYIKYQKDGWAAWIGKNSINLWKTNEILWDNDVKPEGIGVHKSIHFYGTHVPGFQINAGYFFINDNDYTGAQAPTTFNQQSNLTFVQLGTSYSFNRQSLTLTPTYIFARLPESLDYKIFAGMISYKLYYDYSLYANYYYNFSRYEGKEQMNANLQDQKTGYDIGLGWRYRKFKAKLMYAYIEKYAVIDFLSQDNWLLPATNDTQYGSNFKGWSSRFSYLINGRMSVALNVWYAEQIRSNTPDLGLFKATRIRLDFDFQF